MANTNPDLIRKGISQIHLHIVAAMAKATCNVAKSISKTFSIFTGNHGNWNFNKSDRYFNTVFELKTIWEIERVYFWCTCFFQPHREKISLVIESQELLIGIKDTDNKISLIWNLAEMTSFTSGILSSILACSYYGRFKGVLISSTDKKTNDSSETVNTSNLTGRLNSGKTIDWQLCQDGALVPAVALSWMLEKL